MMVVIAVMCIMASCNNTKPKEPEVVETKDTTEGINLEDGQNGNIFANIQEIQR